MKKVATVILDTIAMLIGLTLVMVLGCLTVVALPIATICDSLIEHRMLSESFREAIQLFSEGFNKG